MDVPADDSAEPVEFPLSAFASPQASGTAPIAPGPEAADDAQHDAYAALRVPAFRRYISGNLLSIVGMQMQTTAVGWEIYQLTGSAMSLAWVGLVQVLPVVVLALFAGQVADRFNRRTVISIAVSTVGLASLGLALNSFLWHSVAAMYGLLFVTGVARAFQQPAKSSFMPTLVPKSLFSNAVTWGSSTFQFASVIGPAAGGWVIAASDGAAAVYACEVAATVVFLVLLRSIPHTNRNRSTEPVTKAALVAGIRFLRRNPVILGAITLDMFAVLLGGATALLPIFAEDILDVGAQGLGWLRAAPAVGAILSAMVIAHRPPMKKAGAALLWSVVGFGIATIVFGFSESFYLSVAMMFLAGVMDSISVVVRHTLVQVLTPDEMRGRVSAVNGMFISISNELGEFESGTVANFFGPVFAVVSGGIGTIVIVALSATLFPDLRRYGKLGSGGPEEEAATDAGQAQSA
jgi:MFS family permease